MAKKTCPDDEFISLIKGSGAAQTAKILNINIRAVHSRRVRLERIYGDQFPSPNHAQNYRVSDYPKRVPLELKDGVCIIGSDAHYWPGIVSTAHRGLVAFIRDLKPKAVILNGDVFDGAGASRHDSIMWANPPSIKEELEAVDERTDEVRHAAKGAKIFWTIGNHDQRFESRLAADSPKYRGVVGSKLSDQFPHWEICWSIWINDQVVVKHRFKGGVHATHNNTVCSGKTTICGHLHSLKVTPYADYNGNRFGVDTGTLADPYGPQFEYSEDNPLNHRSGFIVLTFYKGQLLWPEVVHVINENHVEFRGKVIRV